MTATLTAPAPAPATPAPARKPLIYVLEDNQVMCSLICLHLQQGGYDVRGFEDAVEGGKALLDQPPDLLVLDIMLPYLDGLDLLRAMRTDERTRNMPVVILTSRTDTEAELEAKAAGAAGYLNKPLQRQALIDAVGKALQSRPDAG